MSEDTSSSSTMITFPTAKLNGYNYLLWAQALRIFIGAQNKLAHLLSPPPATTNTTYET